jgi:hypothetical protein
MWRGVDPISVLPSCRLAVTIDKIASFLDGREGAMLVSEVDGHKVKSVENY